MTVDAAMWCGMQLIRKYEIHARVKTASMLLACALPHHESAFFGRILNLVDLAEARTWSFLRPYAADGATPPQRNVLAKNAAKDDALFTICCEMGQTAAKVHASEIMLRGDDQSVRTGISRVISFAAAVVVEALDMQVQNAPTSSLSEQTLRNILPYVVSACESSKPGKNKIAFGQVCADWRMFGYIVAAAVAERCVLSPQVKEVLTVTIVKGAAVMGQAGAGGVDDSDDDDEEETMEALDITADAFLTVLAVLLRGRRDVQDQKDFAFLLVDGVEKGCVLPRKTFMSLCRHRLLAPTLGYIVETREEEDISPFLAAFLALALKMLSSSKEGARCGSEVIKMMVSLRFCIIV